jgi:putative inorganic carbon (HCO3(-)) transporter
VSASLAPSLEPHGQAASSPALRAQARDPRAAALRVPPPNRRRERRLWVVALTLILLAGSGSLAAVAHQRGAGAVAFALVLLAALSPAIVIALLRIAPAWLVTAGLMGSVFAGNWSHLGVPFGIERIPLLAGVLLALLRVRLEPERGHLPFRPIYLLLLVVAVYATGSALFAHETLGHNEIYSLFDRLGYTSFLLFAVAPAVFPTRRERMILLGGLTALAAYLAVTTLAEGLGIDALVFPKYILDPDVGLHANRARGPFVEAAANGLALDLSAIAAFCLASLTPSRAIRRIAFGVGLACVCGVIFTLTRQVWLATVLSGVVTMAVAPGLRRYLLPAMVAAVTGVLLAMVAVPGLQKDVVRRANSDRPVWDRLNSNAAALRMVADHPVLGVGWGAFADRVPPYYRLAQDYPLTTVGALHNVFLSTAVELGLLGLLAWLGAFGWAIVSGVSVRGPPEAEVWRLGLVAVALCWGVVALFVPLDFYFDNAMVWVWSGVTWAAGRTLVRPVEAVSVIRAAPAGLSLPAPRALSVVGRNLVEPHQEVDRARVVFNRAERRLAQARRSERLRTAVTDTDRTLAALVAHSDDLRKALGSSAWPVSRAQSEDPRPAASSRGR